MNEFTLTLAVLVRKDILTVEEAKALQKSRSEGVVSANLGEMIAKVDQAIRKPEQEIDKVDARSFFGQ